VDTDTWRAVLVAALAINAALGLGYRIYRLTRKGPTSDVIGQALLAALLAAVAIGTAMDLSVALWAALLYGIFFGVVVMPIWVLAVLFPSRPEWPDYTFTTIYWIGLGVIVAAAVAL
jgi:hypothetical protein